MSRTEFLKKRKRNKQNSLKICTRTQQESDQINLINIRQIDELGENRMYTPNNQFIKFHKPFLHNSKIHFNIRSNRAHLSTRHNYSSSAHDYPLSEKQTNIEKLKRQIVQLENDDFMSFRTKTFAVDEIKVTENNKIAQYNQQNSMMVEWRGKSQNNSEHRFRNVTGQTNVPRKYYSRPKAKSKQICSMILLGDAVHKLQKSSSDKKQCELNIQSLPNFTMGLSVNKKKRTFKKRNETSNYYR